MAHMDVIFDREHDAYEFIENFDVGLIVYPTTFTFNFELLP